MYTHLLEYGLAGDPISLQTQTYAPSTQAIPYACHAILNACPAFLAQDMCRPVHVV